VSDISRLEFRNSIPPKFTDFMQLYYAALPVFADERCIEAIINCLCSKLWSSYTLEKKHFLNKNASEYMYNDYTPEPTKQSIEVLEQRYNDESLLMEYVAHGDFESIDKLAHLNSSGIKPRLSDSIRDRKNFMIILNTLCRKAAQSAYVHPIHLDEISRKFAIRIESCTTIAQLETLESDITRRYCMLVQSYSLRTYSKPVQNIINYISFNLTADLSLTAISTEFSLNSSYLSTLFKKETGMTYTEYVMFCRLEKAKELLADTGKSIAEIADAVGYHDTRHFSKLFTRNIGLKPSEYRKLYS
jgi:YesN/AraC family two-component response regulator